MTSKCPYYMVLNPVFNQWSKPPVKYTYERVQVGSSFVFRKKERYELRVIGDFDVKKYIK